MLKKIKTLIKGVLILGLPSIFLIIGCAREPQLRDRLLDSLIDTVHAGQNREVLLTSLTGGFYYDDAFRNQARGEYGYSNWERKLLAGWRILDPDGNPVDDEPDICIVRPDRIERLYLSGITETVECPPGINGLFLTIKPGRQKGFIFRPYYDFRRLDEEEAPQYESSFDRETNSVAVSRIDHAGGWLAVTLLARDRFIEAEETVRITHPIGELTGRSSVSVLFAAGDLVHRSRKPMQVAIGWGQTREEAVNNAGSILSSVEQWQDRRLRWMIATLQTFRFECENNSFEKAFAWARLTFADLMTNYNGERFLITGIPYHPYPDGWHTALSAYAVGVSSGNPDLALDLIDALIVRQNRDTSSSKYGMFPGKIGEYDKEYRIPEIAGLAARAYTNLANLITEKDTTREDSLAAALSRDLLGTARSRLHQGFVKSGPDEHFLWDSPAAPDREGATFETQLLFGSVRSFLKQYKRLELVADILPSLLNPSGTWATVKKSGDFDMPLGFTTGISGNFEVPVPTEVATFFFTDGSFKNRVRADRLLLHRKDGKTVLLPAEPDTTRFVSVPFATIGDRMGNIEQSNKYLHDLFKAGYIAEAGLRSLAETEDDYQPVHLYQLDNAPFGTTSMGDVLLWTSGSLAQLYMNASRNDELVKLAEALARRVFTSGIIGGIPQAENGFPQVEIDNSTGSLVHCTSLAGFVTIVIKGVLGLNPAPGGYLRFIPNIPASWGNYRISSDYSGGSYIVERMSDTVWRVSQQNIEPAFRIELNLSNELDRTARQSLRLYPDDEIEVIFFRTEDGRWKSEVKPL